MTCTIIWCSCIYLYCVVHVEPHWLQCHFLQNMHHSKWIRYIFKSYRHYKFFHWLSKKNNNIVLFYVYAECRSQFSFSHTRIFMLSQCFSIHQFHCMYCAVIQWVCIPWLQHIDLCIIILLQYITLHDKCDVSIPFEKAQNSFSV